MWAAEEVYKTALFGESYNSASISSYENSWTATNEGFTVSLTNFNNNKNGWSYVKCGRKNYESTGTIATESAIDKAVTKVVVTVDAFTSGKVNSFKLYVASNAEFTTDVQTISHSIATGANTFTVTAPSENQFYKIEIDCASGSSNGLVQISKIEYFYDNSPVGDDRDPAGLSYSTDVFSATIGETNTFPTLNNPNSLTVTYASSDESIATINSNGAITLLAAGETVISASFAGNDSYKEGSASYTLTVIDPNAPGMSAENPYTITQAKAAIDAGTGVTGVYVEGVISQIDSYNTTYHSITYWISTDGSTADFEVYSGRGLNNTDFAAVTDLKVGDQVVIYGNIKKYNSTYEFDKENYIVSLVREEKQEPELAFNPTSVEINVGDTFTAPTLSNPHNVAVTYESSNTNVATVSANGAVTLAGSTGTTTITASFAGDDSFFAGEASYTLTVVDPNAPGASADNPYTVAQARAAIDAGTGVTGVYATGIVSKIVTAYNSQYGNITYDISVDGSETADQLRAYRGFSYDGEWFTSADDIQVGDVVVVKGNLTKYNSTYEFAEGNQLVSLTRPVNTDPVISAEDVTLAYDATSGEIAYTISNVDEGTELDDATPNADWISGITIASDKVTFTTTANEGTEDRTATITLTYGDVTKDVTVTQGHFIVDYATLPFEYDGNGSGTLPNGLTQKGLGTYTSSPAMKFDGSGDELVLHFNEQPGTLTFDIKGNSFSGGTFKVQTSVDGVTYTDLKSYTALTSTVQSEEFDIDANVRYIKWVFTEKASGNVALGNINLTKYAAKYAVHIGENITNGTVTADKAEAAEGATVTLTATPAENYVFGAWTVTTESGTSVEVEDNTFVMPAEPVTVSATFTEIVVKAGDYKKVTSSADLTDGEYLIVYEGALVAFNGGLETLDATSNTIDVEINGNVIPSSTEVDAATFTIDVTAGTLKSKSGQYIGVSSNSNGLKQTEDAETYTHTFSIDEEGNAVISAAFEGSTMSLRFNSTTNQARFRYYKDAGQEAIQLYKKVASDETLKGDVNRDGKQSIADVTALVNIILGKATPDTNPEYDFDAADVNGDGGVPTIADVTALVNIILGKE